MESNGEIEIRKKEEEKKSEEVEINEELYFLFIWALFHVETSEQFV
jgi:hypothetical protein